MDENKFNKLKEINYKINKCCYLCKHCNNKNNLFSTCKLFKYEHLKHSDSYRELSISILGICDNFEYDIINDINLHKFKDLIKWD
jgi:hypothetical protein